VTVHVSEAGGGLVDVCMSVTDAQAVLEVAQKVVPLGIRSMHELVDHSVQQFDTLSF
jgi:hypothetical protein